MQEIINTIKKKNSLLIISTIAILSVLFCTLKIDVNSIDLIPYSHAENSFISIPDYTTQKVVFSEIVKRTDSNEVILKSTGSTRKFADGNKLELLALSAPATLVCAYAFFRLCAYRPVLCSYHFIISFIHNSDGMKP